MYLNSNRFTNIALIILCIVASLIFLPHMANGQACVYHAYQQCAGNNLYWYDSCGSQQEYIGFCDVPCLGGSCQNYYNYNNYGNCTYHAYRECVGNSVYWYSSCGQQQDLYYTCGGGQVCKYGQCTTYTPPYTERQSLRCYGSSLYWYDSMGSNVGLYKNCADNNTCTLDSCSANKCLNEIKCDGTTCESNSADYTKYCSTAPTNKCGDGTCDTTAGETPENCATDCQTPISGLSISFLGKEVQTGQWQKATQVKANGQVYFIISVQNNSAVPIGDATVSVSIPTEVYSLGNVQIDGVPVAGDIISGVSIGSLPPYALKTVTLEGRTQAISTDETKQATAVVSASGTNQSDSISINFSHKQATAALSEPIESTGFLGFIKRWYLWILGGLILVFLFGIVFKRMTSES